MLATKGVSMFIIIVGVLLLSLMVAFKILKGVIKLVLILIIVGLLIGSFAGKDQIDSMPAPVQGTAT
jgi:uncharacterized membrane protein